MVELSIKGNNLYRTGEVIVFEGSDEMLLVRDLLTYEGAVHDSYYVVGYEDRLDIIAYKYYKNIVEDASKYWWVIADVNGIQNPLDLNEWVGKEILIPNILNVLLDLQ